ncbi:MAG: hypothetical protein LJE84_03385 [Gammaproteobacteria bacterium]|nr:hypothetical protein [Gammaproteobacteria bacterium]
MTRLLRLVALIAVMGWAPSPQAASPDPAELPNLATLFASAQPHNLQAPVRQGDWIITRVTGPDPWLLLPLDHKLRDLKLRVELRDFRQSKYLRLYRARNGISLDRGTPEQHHLADHGNNIVTFTLPNGHYQALRLDFEGVRIDRNTDLAFRVQLVPRGLLDNGTMPYLAAFGMALLILVPAILLQALFWSRADPRLSLLIGPGVSLLLLLALYLAGYTVGENSRWALPAGMALAMTAVLVLVWRRKRVQLRSLWRAQRRVVGLYLLLCLGATALVSHDTPLPFDNLDFKSISGPKTFDAFRAHDNLFQYLNGNALATRIPITAPYAGGRLVYVAQDRGILAGAAWAGLRLLLEPMSSRLGTSFFSYTLLAICLNALLVLPLWFLLNRHFRRGRGLALLALVLTACGLVNFWFAWFKFAAGALLLGGLLLVLERQAGTARWLGAGLLCGLAAGLHQSAALGIPVLLLWLGWRHARAAGFGRALWQLLLLTGVFALTQLPWKLYAALYLGPTDRMLRSFLIAGHSHPDGLLAAIWHFWATTPLAEQFAERAGNLWASLRLAELAELAKLALAADLGGLALRWNQLEFGRLAILFYPLTGLWLLDQWLRRRHQLPLRLEGDAEERQGLAAAGALTLLAVILVAFGRYLPDVPYHQPLGVIAMLYVLLAARVANGVPLVRKLFFAWLALAALRLGLFL